MQKSSRKKIQDTKIVLKIDQYIYDSCVNLQIKHFNEIVF